MPGRDFSKIGPGIWHSSRFRALSDRGQLLTLYFMSNSHVTSAGVYYLPPGYACADLGWDSTSYDQARAEVIGAGLIDYDEDAEIVLVERWFKHNPPMNDDHASGCRKRISALESDRLREKAEAAFEEANGQRLDRQAQKALARTVKKQDVTTVIGDTSRLMGTRMMRGNHG